MERAQARQSSLWESKIELGEKFFNEIIQHPVPLDMNTLTALKRCSLGLDLYLWLTYRTFALRAPQRITWRQCTVSLERTRPAQRTIAPFKSFGSRVLPGISDLDIRLTQDTRPAPRNGRNFAQRRSRGGRSVPTACFSFRQGCLAAAQSICRTPLRQ